MRTVRFPPPTRWRRPCTEGAECGRRKPGRCLEGASGEGPGAADRGWRDAVPGKRSRRPLRKAERGVAFPAPPMYASLSSGPVAALPASVPPVTLGARSSGGGRGRVPREGRRPGGARACGGGASVWQVSAAAHAGGSHPGPAGPRAARSRPAPPAFGWPRARRLPVPQRGRGSRLRRPRSPLSPRPAACRPALGAWVGRPVSFASALLASFGNSGALGRLSEPGLWSRREGLVVQRPVGSVLLETSPGRLG